MALAKGRFRFLIAAIGFAAFLAMNSFSLWGFSDLPQRAFGTDTSGYWTIPLQLSNVATFLLYCIGSRPAPDKPNPFPGGSASHLLRHDLAAGILPLVEPAPSGGCRYPRGRRHYLLLHMLGACFLLRKPSPRRAPHYRRLRRLYPRFRAAFLFRRRHLALFRRIACLREPHPLSPQPFLTSRRASGNPCCALS